MSAVIVFIETTILLFIICCMVLLVMFYYMTNADCVFQLIYPRVHLITTYPVGKELISQLLYKSNIQTHADIW